MSLRNFLNILLRLPAIKFGIPTASSSDISGSTFVCEGPCFRPSLLETVLLRPAQDMGCDFLLPRLPDSRALTSRRLSARDSACVALSMNHTFAGMVGGCAYSPTPCFVVFSRRRGFEFRRRLLFRIRTIASLPSLIAPFPRAWVVYLRLKSMRPMDRPSALFCAMPKLLPLRVFTTPII